MLFQQIDALIAFALIMLILSVFITSLVQLVVSLFGLRGKNLRWGITRLLEQMDGRFAADAGPDPKEVANKVLTHPTLAPATILKSSPRPATAIEPRDLIRLLDALRKDGKLESAQGVVEELFATKVGLEGDQVDIVNRALAELKKELPQEKAVIERVVEGELGKASKIVVKVDQWFDSVMDATSERFKLWTRWITIGAAFALTFLFQVDSASLFRQLTSNPAVTAAIVEQAADGQGLFRSLQAAAEAPAAASATAAGAPAATGASTTGDDVAARKAAFKRVESVLLESRGLLEATGLNVLDPVWREETRRDLVDGFAGKLMTIFFLSLGAPFWYGALAKLLGLKSAVAQRMEQKRAT